MERRGPIFIGHRSKTLDGAQAARLFWHLFRLSLLLWSNIDQDNGEAAENGHDGEVCVLGKCVTKGYEMREHMDSDPNIAAFHTLTASSGNQEALDIRDNYRALL